MVLQKMYPCHKNSRRGYNCKMKRRVHLTDEEASFVECLYREYYRLMFSVTRRFDISEHDKQDVISTAMLSLMNNINTLQRKPPDERKYYITRATITASINYLKRLRMDKGKVRGDVSSITEVVSSTDFEEQLLLKIELSNVLNSIMDLPEKEGLCIRYKYLSGYNNSEIASLTGLSENSVNQYIMMARKKIRSMTYESGDSEING